MEVWFRKIIVIQGIPSSLVHYFRRLLAPLVMLQNTGLSFFQEGIKLSHVFPLLYCIQAPQRLSMLCTFLSTLLVLYGEELPLIIVVIVFC